MYIHEAVKLCDNFSFMRRHSWPAAWRVRPTNEPEYHCIAFATYMPEGRKFWNPKAEDLIADDWEVFIATSEFPALSGKTSERLPLTLECD